VGQGDPGGQHQGALRSIRSATLLPRIIFSRRIGGWRYERSIDSYKFVVLDETKRKLFAPKATNDKQHLRSGEWIDKR
jgi:hypothetical protein